jgi:transcriptional regulator with XRE-family HTH domain
MFSDYDPNTATAIEPPATARVAMITATQCRSARALLGWSLAKLAAAALVSESDIDDFELERRVPDIPTVDAIERAFAAVGVAFSPDGDIRLVSRREANG